MATYRARGNSIEIKAYAGVDPATGKKDWKYDRIPVADAFSASGGHSREMNRKIKALDAKAEGLLSTRRDRRRDPQAPPKKKTVNPAWTIRDAVEVAWAKHFSKLASARNARHLIDSLILPHLGDTLVVLTAGTPPDDDDDRDPDLVYLSERWEEIAKVGRIKGDAPLKPSGIHRAHGIVGYSLRRAGHPISDPGLASIGDKPVTTPNPAEMQTFLPYLAGGRARKGYEVTRRVRGSLEKVSYKVGAAAVVEPTAMGLMLEAAALLVGSGPRPFEACALTRSQVDTRSGDIGLTGTGVIAVDDADGKEQWVVAFGETDKRRVRDLTADDRTLAAIRRWWAFQDEYALACGIRLTGRAQLFSLDPDAKVPLSPKVLSRAFDQAVVRSVRAGHDLPAGFHLYDMRHFGITQALRAGNAVADVAYQYGTSAKMIYARYAHPSTDGGARITKALEAVWGPSGGTEGGTVVALRREGIEGPGSFDG